MPEKARALIAPRIIPPHCNKILKVCSKFIFTPF